MHDVRIPDTLRAPSRTATTQILDAHGAGPRARRAGCRPARAAPEPGPGDRLGPYRVARQLAIGGFGAVFAAEHCALGRPVGLKVLHARHAHSALARAGFAREARLVNRVRHRNVIDVHDLGRLRGGRPFFVMELLHGHDLSDLLRGHGPYHLDEAAALVAPLCDALAAVHGAGIVHRDVKAANVFVDGAGAAPRVVLLDFGLAREIGDPPGRDGATAVMGTPTCMAPEQIRGEACDPRTDVYAIGALLFHLLTGQPPFWEATSLILDMHLYAPPPRPSVIRPVPPAVDALIARAMAKEPGRRHPSVADLARELAQVGA